MKNIKYILVVVVILVVGYAVSGMMSRGGDGGSSLEKKTVGSPDSSAVSGGVAPKDWPSDAPLYSGASSGQPGANGAVVIEGPNVVVMNTDKPIADVLAYYRSNLKSMGWTVEGDEMAGPYAVLSATKGGNRFSLVVTVVNGRTSISSGINKI